MKKHDKNCQWEKTTEQQCEYRNTHEYCPHPEHVCTCKMEEQHEPLIRKVKKCKCGLMCEEPIFYNCTLSKFAEQMNVPLYKAMEFGKYFKSALRSEMREMIGEELAIIGKDENSPYNRMLNILKQYSNFLRK